MSGWAVLILIGLGLLGLGGAIWLHRDPLRQKARRRRETAIRENRRRWRGRKTNGAKR